MLAQAAGLGCAVPAVTDPSPSGFDMDPLESPSGRQGGSSVVALSASQVSDASPALEKPKTFADTFRKALDQPLLRSPCLRITRSARRSLDPDFVPKRSARLAAKSGFREGRPDAQAHRVMLRCLGLGKGPIAQDDASFNEFQNIFAKPLTPSRRSALEALFPGRKSKAADAATI